MSQALADCQNKIIRAEKHLHELRTEVERLFKREPYVFAFDQSPHDPGDVRVLMRVNEEPSSYLGAILGDFLVNCHSVLDYIVTALDRAAGGSGNKSYFPLYENRRRFNKAASSRVLQRLDPSHLALIESVQPFQWTNRPPSQHPGAVIKRLTRIDKHQAITPAFMAPHTIQIRFIYDDGTHDVQSAPVPLNLDIKDGAQIAHVFIADEGQGKVEMKPLAKFDLKFTGPGSYTIAYPAATTAVLTWTRDEVLTRFAPILRRIG